MAFSLVFLKPSLIVFFIWQGRKASCPSNLDIEKELCYPKEGIVVAGGGRTL
jgi:hypothetical protein